MAARYKRSQQHHQVVPHMHKTMTKGVKSSDYERQGTFHGENTGTENTHTHRKGTGTPSTDLYLHLHRTKNCSMGGRRRSSRTHLCTRKNILIPVPHSVVSCIHLPSFDARSLQLGLGLGP